MEEQSNFRHWDELIPYALGLIFSNLSLKEVLTVIPSVCKSWKKAVTGPYCWQEIDIEEWSNRYQVDHLDRMIRMLITRSSGSLRKLCVSGLKNDTIFSFITENAGSLQMLRLRRSEMCDSIVEQTAGRLSAITFLDLSYCGNIGARALETIGKHCKLLVSLCRNMDLLDAAEKFPQDDEANAIAATMPKLKHLEMACHLITTRGVLNILSGCPQLELLNLYGCGNVKLDNQLLKEKFPKLKVLGPVLIIYYKKSDYSDSSEYLGREFEMGDYDDYDIDHEMWHNEGRLEELELDYDSSEYLGWEFEMGDYGDYDIDHEMWHNEGRLEELELGFYEGIDQMEEQSNFRHWDELIPDALGLIFSNLSLKEVLTVIPSVCKSWKKAVTGPYCWQEIDIEEWSNRYQVDHLDRMIRMLITRSSGSLRKFCVSGLKNDTIFSFITENAGSLQTLRLRRSEMCDSIVEQTAGRLSAITFLDLSYCGNIGARALETIGKHCKLLVSLCRNMDLLHAAEKFPQDDEANAIAATMPKLKHLEMACHLITTGGVLNILSGCPRLEFLNVYGCGNVKLDNQLLKEKFPKLKVLGPVLIIYYKKSDYSDSSEYLGREFEMGDYDDYDIDHEMWHNEGRLEELELDYDSSEYLGWEFEMGDYGDYDIDHEMWHNEGRLEELELGFYEGVGEDAGIFGWPPSP